MTTVSIDTNLNWSPSDQLRKIIKSIFKLLGSIAGKILRHLKSPETPAHYRSIQNEIERTRNRYRDEMWFYTHMR